MVPAERRDEAERVVAEAMGGPEAGPERLRSKLGEIAGYVGAALVVAAAALFVIEQWDSMSQGERVAWIGGMSIVLGVVGLVVSFVGTGFEGMRSEAGAVRRRLAGTVFAGMAATAAIAAMLQADRFNPAEEAWIPVAGFGTLAVLGLLGYWIAPTAIGQAPVAAGLFGVIPALLSVFIDEGANFTTSMALLEISLAALWWGATEAEFWRPREIGLIAAFGIALIGAQMPVMAQERPNLGYLLTAVVATAAFAGYAFRPAWPYLGAGVIAVTLVVPEAITDWTDESIGTAGAVLLAGVTLLIASLASFRMHTESHRTHRSEKPPSNRHFHRPHLHGV
jgi:hypothetical protein